MIRFYYNQSSEAPFVASVDHGPGTEEIKVCGIVCYSPSISNCDLDAPEGQPRFWMQAIDAEDDVDIEVAHAIIRAKRK